jgi:hypothetical protein
MVKMLRVLIFVGFALVVINFLVAPPKNKSPREIRDMQLAIRPWSGLNKDIYLDYVNNLEQFGTTMDSEYLYKAMDKAYELELYGNEQFSHVVNQIGILGERMIVQTNISFEPRYLNDIEPFYTDVDYNSLRKGYKEATVIRT